MSPTLTDIMTNRSDLRSYLAAQTRQVMAAKDCVNTEACDTCPHRLPAVGTLPHGVYCAEHGCRVETRDSRAVQGEGRKR